MIEDLILKFGLSRVIGAGVMLALGLVFAGWLGWAKVSAWYYHHQDTKHTAQRDEARVEARVARADEAQATRSAAIATTTTAAQDAHASAQRAATAHVSEVIHERIVQVPVAVPAADDLVVRHAVDQARARAQAAIDRLQGTPGH